MVLFNLYYLFWKCQGIPHIAPQQWWNSKWTESPKYYRDNDLIYWQYLTAFLSCLEPAHDRQVRYFPADVNYREDEPHGPSG